MTEAAIDAETAFELLRNARRRHLLSLLAQTDSALSLRTAAKSIVAETHELPVDLVDDGAYRSVYVSLYQNHVPKLVDAGVVDFEESERRVTLERGPEARELLRLLGCEFRDCWETAYSTTISGATAIGCLTAVLLSEVFAGAVLSVFVLSLGLALLGAYQYLVPFTGWQRPWRIDMRTAGTGPSKPAVGGN